MFRLPLKSSFPVNLKSVLGMLLVLTAALGSYFLIGNPPQAETVTWGINFSQKHAEYLGLNWKHAYSAFLKDLNARNIKIATHWDLLEPQENSFYFDDLDWQIRQAEEHQVQLTLAIGMKTPRWPECHIPNWAKDLDQETQQKEILKLLKKIVTRYKNSKAIKYWQVENEPFFPYGDCPWVDKKFLKEEVALVKSLDTVHPVIVSDSGEGSFWINAAGYGDIVGTTLYKKVWSRHLKNYIYYPFPPIFYWRKAQIIKKLFNKKVICVELQAEPWGPTLLYDAPLEEQTKSMNPQQLANIISFAKQTGLDEFYFWGAEWWYWLKTVHNDTQIWKLAKQTLAA